jgi:3-hydroxymyristoyl/3-hydroxydecanoyl-(acyl carrier protein) dehydratase
MRFLFVSKIHEIEGNRVKGQVQFSTGEPWRRERDGAIDISTSVVSEAIGQLVSWMALRDNQFTGRPVFLFATEISLLGRVQAPATVELEAWITDQSDDSFIFSGCAKVDGKTLVEIKDCGGYFMPLGDLEDPTVTMQRFKVLTNEGLPANPASVAFDFTSLIDEIHDLQNNQSITATKVMSPAEPFYPDHFPRFAVTPIVVINEMIAEATRRMVHRIDHLPNHKVVSSNRLQDMRIEPMAVNDLKIKSFIRPGDTATVSVRKTESQDDQFETIAEISVNHKRILRGRYRYRYVNSNQSNQSNQE